MTSRCQCCCYSERAPKPTCGRASSISLACFQPHAPPKSQTRDTWLKHSPQNYSAPRCCVSSTIRPSEPSIGAVRLSAAFLTHKPTPQPVDESMPVTVITPVVVADFPIYPPWQFLIFVLIAAAARDPIFGHEISSTSLRGRQDGCCKQFAKTFAVQASSPILCWSNFFRSCCKARVRVGPIAPTGIPVMRAMAS